MTITETYNESDSLCDVQRFWIKFLKKDIWKKISNLKNELWFVKENFMIPIFKVIMTTTEKMCKNSFQFMNFNPGILSLKIKSNLESVKYWKNENLLKSHSEMSRKSEFH